MPTLPSPHRLLPVSLLLLACGGAQPASSVDAGTDTTSTSACGTGTPAWTKQSQPSPLPTETTSASVVMAFDPVGREALLFAGYLGTPSGQNHTWTLKGTNGKWTERTPSSPSTSWPTARGESAMVWDPVRRTVVMFGGLSDSGNGFTDELWEWDGAAGTWNDLTPAQRPAAWPQGRAAHAIAYDTARGRLVMSGGWGPLKYPGYAPDLWEWNSADQTWTDRTPATLPADWPTARQSAAMVYDTSVGRVVMFGGWSNAPLGDTWEWDGAAGGWTNRTPTTAAQSGPPSGEWLMVFDPCRNRTVLLGGTGLVQNNVGLGVVLPQVWEWTSSAGAWSTLIPSPVPASWPSARPVLAAAWDDEFMHTLAVLAADPPATAGTPTAGDTWIWGVPPPDMSASQ